MPQLRGHARPRVEHLDRDRGAVDVERPRRVAAQQLREVGIGRARDGDGVPPRHDRDRVKQRARGRLLEQVGEHEHEGALRLADLAERALVRRDPERPLDVYRAAVAVEVLAARERVAARLRRSAAEVLEAPARSLPAACVSAYLRAKARALL